MHAWEIMMSLSIGILGGIVSSVIVSRIFDIVNSINEQLRGFEENLNRLLNIRGMITGIKQVMEFTYDSETKKEMEIKQKGYRSESEYYQAHKEARWIDADVLIMNLLRECQKRGNELLKSISETLATEEQKIQELYRDIHKIINSISQIKNVTFKNLQQVDADILRVEKEFGEYKKQIRKLYWKNIFTDKVVILISLLVVIFLATTIIMFVNNI